MFCSLESESSRSCLSQATADLRPATDKDARACFAPLSQKLQWEKLTVKFCYSDKGVHSVYPILTVLLHETSTPRHGTQLFGSQSVNRRFASSVLLLTPFTGCVRVTPTLCEKQAGKIPVYNVMLQRGDGRCPNTNLSIFSCARNLLLKMTVSICPLFDTIMVKVSAVPPHPLGSQL